MLSKEQEGLSSVIISQSHDSMTHVQSFYFLFFHLICNILETTKLESRIIIIRKDPLFHYNQDIM